MTPSQLLARIEQLGVVDAKYITKIRSQIDDPEKVVKNKAVVAYLIKKSQITSEQATALLAPLTEDEMVVVQQVEKTYETDNLIGVPEVAEPAVEAVASVVQPVQVDATQMDHPNYREADVDVVDVQPIEEPQIIAPNIAGNPPPMDPMTALDPNGGLGSGAYQAAGSGAYQTAQSGEQKTLPTFVGKKDSSDQFNTKWLYIGFSILGLLLIGTALFYILLAGQTPDEMFEAANKAYIASAYPDCITKCDRFLEKFSSHSRAPTVRAMRTHSVLRNMFNSKNFEELILQCDELLPKLAEEKDSQYSIFRDDIGVIMPAAFQVITERAVESMATDGTDIDTAKMEEKFNELKTYDAIVQNPNYVTNSARKISSIAAKLADAENNLQTIQGLITKEKSYLETLDIMTKLRDEGKTDQAFGRFREITRQYGDIRARKALQDLIVTLSEKESELVQPVELELPVKNQPRTSPIESTVVLASTYGTPVKSLQDEVIPFLIDGSAIGVDAGTGRIAWRIFVGYQTDIDPVVIDEDRTLVSDLLHNDLICLETLTGKTIWRQELGERFASPAVNLEKIVVSTVNGNVIELNTTSGQVQHASKLPQGTNVSALVGERDPYIYQVGKYSNLYVISSNTFACEEVYALGHKENSVTIPPIQWTGYILVVENGGGYSNLHVFRPTENGLGLTRVQLIPRVLDAPVSHPFVRAGRSMLLVADNGQIRLMDIDPTTTDAPIQPYPPVQLQDTGDISPFLSAQGSQVWFTSNGIINARVKRAQGTINRELVKESRDEFLSKAIKLDDYLLSIRRRFGSGMLTVSLSDMEKMEPVWSTDFGGDLADGLIKQDNQVWAVSNQGDLFSVDGTSVQSGYATDPKRGSKIVEDLRFNDVVPLGDGKLAAVGPKDKSDLLFFNGEENKVYSIMPPADKPSSGALAVDGGLLIPSTTGYISMVQPNTGAIRGVPFQRPVGPESVVNWLKPIEIRKNVVAVASAKSKGETSKLFLLSTENPNQMKELGSIEPPASFKNQISSNGNGIVGVLDKDGIDSLALFTSELPLAASTTVDLDGDCVDGPWWTEGGIFVKLNNDRLYCFSDDLTKKWSAKVPNVKLACEPEIAGATLRLIYQNGVIELLSIDDGSSIAKVDLEQPINHRPLSVGDKVYLSGMDGTIHVYNPVQK